jgi:hypothetical protein
MKKTFYRGMTVTDEDVIQAMELFDKQFRSTFPEKRWVTYAIEYNGKLYPPKQILRIATGGEVGGGGKSINSRFVELGFKIVTLDENKPLPIDAPVTEEDETALSLEYDLENSLISNLEQLEKGLKLYQADGITGQQVDAKAAGRIDLLAIDANNDLVVIELKAGEADRQVCGQILGYMGWVKENIGSERRVRGIIIASDFTEKTVYAARVVPNLSLKKYQVGFKFSDIT